jgi:hypothetical protein
MVKHLHDLEYRLCDPARGAFQHFCEICRTVRGHKRAARTPDRPAENPSSLDTDPIVRPNTPAVFEDDNIQGDADGRPPASLPRRDPRAGFRQSASNHVGGALVP